MGYCLMNPLMTESLKSLKSRSDEILLCEHPSDNPKAFSYCLAIAYLPDLLTVY
jgi:hypothetical protein